MPKDGSPMAVDLEIGRATTARQGDIVLECWTQNEGMDPNLAQPYDWRFRLTVPGGGVVERTDEFAFEAPAEGYREVVEFAMPKDAERWKQHFEAEYFVKLGDGRYARMQFRITTGGAHFATAKMGNQTVRFQPWGSDIPLPEIESVIDLGDTTSPESPYLLATTTNGTQLLAYNSGSPAGIPVPAPAGAGGGRETTGRKLSNRLVIPTGSGLWRNGRHLPWSRLGGPPSANSTWTAPQITHISPQNHIAAGTVTRLRDANGEPIPEEARQKYAALLLPADLAVDANRDGVIKFAGNPAAAGAYDRTEQSRPFRFWVNDDDDETDGSEKVPVGTPDNQYAFIEGKRDLEDFTRLHISIGGLHEAIVSGTIQIGLEWKNVTGTPAIWVHRAASASGSDDYLKDDTAAEAQIEGVYGVALGKAAHTSPLKIDKAVFQSLSAANPNAYFLFDGAAEGRGRLVMTLWKGSEKIGEGPGVWIDLLDVKKMYVRGQAAPDFQDAPFSHMDSWSPPDIGSQPYENGHPHSKPWDEEKKAVVYVHGINGPWGQADAHASWQADSETMFKRLWHQGFKGRFASFKWLALTPAFPFKFNESEYRGWKCGRGLAQFIGSLPGDYQKNLYSFSQGAIVCGSALTVYQASVHNYVMSQAAAPAGCYDASTAVNSYSDFLNAEASMPTPDSTNDLGYRDYFNGLNVSGSVVSFYNEVDYALKTGTELGINVSWEGNQLLSKPNQNLAGRTYAYDSGPPSGLFAIGQRCFLRDIGPPFNQRRLTDIHESMAFVARPRSEAAGASNAVAGSITSRYNVGPDTASNFRDDSTDHSGQFNRRIQQTQDYYSQLLSALLEE